MTYLWTMSQEGAMSDIEQVERLTERLLAAVPKLDPKSRGSGWH